MSFSTGCVACEVTIRASGVDKEILLCSACKCEFLPEKTGERTIYSLTRTGFWIYNTIMGLWTSQEIFLYQDAKELAGALDSLEALDSASAKKEQLTQVLDGIRPINHLFCIYDHWHQALRAKKSLRDTWINRFNSWCLPPREDHLQRMVDFIGNGKVLEVGAGAGLIARILSILGVSVRTTDIRAYNTEGDYTDRRGAVTYLEPEVLSADDAVVKYGHDSDVLLGIWQDTGLSADAFRHFTGTKIISIGEGGQGCTAALFPDEVKLYLRDEGYLSQEETRSPWKLSCCITPLDWKYVQTQIRFFEKKVIVE